MGYSLDPLTDGLDAHPYCAAMKEQGYIHHGQTFVFPVLILMHRSISPALFIISSFLPFLLKVGPPWFRRTLVNLVPSKRVRRLRDVVDVMHNTAVEILETKRRAILEGGEAMTRQVGRGTDLISILSMNHAAPVY